MSYPLSIPDSVKYANVVMTLAHVNSASTSPFTLESQFYRWSGEQWQIDVTIPPTNDRDVAESFITFAMKLKGRFGTFLMGDPSALKRGVWNGTPLVKGGNQTGSTLLIDGASNNVTDYAKIGDYIQIGTGLAARLYKVLANANSDGSGNVSLTVAPFIRPNTPDNAPIIHANPAGLFRMAEDTVSWGYDTNKMFRYSFRALEAL
jgi:hypothetical protein